MARFLIGRSRAPLRWGGMKSQFAGKENALAAPDRPEQPENHGDFGAGPADQAIQADRSRQAEAPIEGAVKLPDHSAA